jgi:hypothetical protein
MRLCRQISIAQGLLDPPIAAIGKVAAGDVLALQRLVRQLLANAEDIFYHHGD